MKALNLHAEIGVDLSFNEYTIGEREDLINLAVNWFFESYYSVHTVSENNKTNKKAVDYHNEIQVEIPVWYLEFHGHDLEDRLKQVFSPLEKYRDEGKLQKELSIIATKCFPLIPEDTVKTISSIINE